MADTIYINNKVYDWADVDLDIPGLAIQIKSIEYDDELEKEHAYGLGNLARGFGSGNYKPNAKLSMSLEDFQEILDYCKRTGTPLYKLMFPKIAVSYANAGGRTRTDILNKVTPMKASQKAAQGDKGIDVDLELLVVGTIDRDGVKPV